MLGVILLVLAVLCFFAAAIGQTIVHQPPLDLVYWGLFFLTLALLLASPIVAPYISRKAP